MFSHKCINFILSASNFCRTLGNHIKNNTTIHLNKHFNFFISVRFKLFLDYIQKIIFLGLDSNKISFD